MKSILKFGIPMLMLAVGAVILWAGSWGRGMIHDQLFPQNITFAPYDASGAKGDTYKAYPQLREYAGRQVTDGEAARAFATYIHIHVQEATGGKTFSQVSAESRANPSDQKLASLRRTALDGVLLEAVMWNTYGWWTLANIALWMGVALLVIGAAALVAALLLKPWGGHKASA